MKLTTDEIERFSAQWQSAALTVRELSAIWGVPEGTLYRWGHELDLSRPKTVRAKHAVLQEVYQYCQQISREMEPYQWEGAYTLYAPNGAAAKCTKHVSLVVMLSDIHAGRMTASFNESVFRARLRDYCEDVLERIRIYRAAGYEVDEVVIAAAGDFVTGEKVGKNIQIEELEAGVIHQIYRLAVPAITAFLLRLREEVDKICVYCVRGNHGSLSKFNPSKAANWDTVVYYAWEAKTSSVPGVHFTIEDESWYQYFNVRGTTFLLTHGDAIRGAGSGLTAKVQAWAGSMPYFDYVLMGHFHTFKRFQKCYLNATLLSDDEWALEAIGANGNCGQLILGVKDTGIDGAYEVELDRRTRYKQENVL